eukprot:TRINITY_DN116360_c0_g1_i1.p1 TRINITY_DN116360_c0_g1~~TRINITY_DN116360_c0_g1_i1.p1  ORF type:complete len:231 (-),score=50.97 TRINITY_DN116360_c0_g1_i1:8-673(-)
MIKQNKTITSLSVGFRIEDDGALLVADALKANNTLKHLSITGTYTNKGVMAIGKALENNTTLKSLTLSSKSSSTGMCALAESLKSTKIKELNVIQEIGDSGALALADLTEVSETLQIIRISESNEASKPFGDDATKALARAIVTNNNINVFTVNGGFGEVGANELAQVPRNAKTVTCMVIESSKLLLEASKRYNEMAAKHTRLNKAIKSNKQKYDSSGNND